MPNNETPSYDPASGRPILRDIVSKSKRLPLRRSAPEKKSVSAPRRKGTEKVEDFFKLKNVPRTPPKPPGFFRKISFPKISLKIGSRREIKSPSRRSLYWTASFVTVFIAGLILLDSFALAIVSVTPRQEFVDIDSVLRASLGGAGDVSLEILTFQDSKELTGEVKNIQNIEARAEGQIVVFNAFSSEPQILVARTRFRAPNGNVYRIQRQVVVPGAKIEDGKIVPQGIEVRVVADEPGEKYNLGLSDFTIPGFQGTPRFEKFYGRSQTEITGGFVGTVPAVSEADVEALETEAESFFSQGFQQKILSDLPEGVFLPPDAYEIDSKITEVDPPVGSRGDSVKVKVDATMRGLAVKRTDIFAFLAQSYLGLGSREEIGIVNWDDLQVEVVTRNFRDNAMTLRIRGRAHFVWEFDEAALKNDLIANMEDRRNAFRNYDAIERAEIGFRPGWWRVFPGDISRIRLEKVLKSE